MLFNSVCINKYICIHVLSVDTVFCICIVLICAMHDTMVEFTFIYFAQLVSI